MTTIYTKPQIDAMAVKIGGEIKAAKTTVTQVKGQSTTEAVSQKMITDSLSAFGTAATRNVGLSAAQIAANEQLYKSVFGGDFGVIKYDLAGLNCDNLLAGERAFVKNDSTLLNKPSLEGIYLFIECKRASNSDDQDWNIQTATAFPSGRTATRYNYDYGYNDWTINAVEGANLPVASIQAGIGAPKIAYKKLTGVTMINTGVPHGLDASKILSISCSYLSGGVYLALIPEWDATEIDIKSISSGFSYKLLITYEV